MTARSRSSSTSRHSAAAARRLVQERALRAHAPVRAEVAAAVSSYRPNAIDGSTWSLVEPVVSRTLHASKVTGVESLRKHVTHLAVFFAWAQNRALPLEMSALTRPNVEAFIATGMPHSSPKSRSDRRAKLRAIADQLHPDQSPRGVAIARPKVKPPYTDAEMATIARVALEQTGQTRRRVCLCVGLGAGAGLASSDLRSLRAGDIEDRGDAGLYVAVPAPRPRRVPVLVDYETLVRTGLRGLSATDLALGLPADARNLAAGAMEDAVLGDDCPHIEQSRLRHTWLALLLTARIPLTTLLEVAGLRSPKTLTDLLEHLSPGAPDEDSLELFRKPEVLR
jgi:integrase